MNTEKWNNMKEKKITNILLTVILEAIQQAKREKSSQLEIERKRVRRKPDLMWIRVAEETMSFEVVIM